MNSRLIFYSNSHPVSKPQNSLLQYLHSDIDPRHVWQISHAHTSQRRKTISPKFSSIMTHILANCKSKLLLHIPSLFYKCARCAKNKCVMTTHFSKQKQQTCKVFRRRWATVHRHRELIAGGRPPSGHNYFTMSTKAARARIFAKRSCPRSNGNLYIVCPACKYTHSVRRREHTWWFWFA